MPVVERSWPVMEGVFLAKIEELVDRSRGQIRADKAHGKLVAIGYQGSPRTTRRWVADAKRRWRRQHGRRTRPWIPEPGLWMQWDYGDGPKIDGVVTVVLRVVGVVTVPGGGRVARRDTAERGARDGSSAADVWGLSDVRVDR